MSVRDVSVHQQAAEIAKMKHLLFKNFDCEHYRFFVTNSNSFCKFKI